LKYFLHKCEILRGHLQFKKIFDTGLIIKSPNLKLFYRLEDEETDDPLKIGFAINKHIRKKVHRNRIRRILKEFFRLNRYDLFISLLNNKKSIKFLVLFSNNNEKVCEKINYEMLSLEFEKLLKEIILKVNK
jgi:ribonuclease P protein component